MKAVSGAFALGLFLSLPVIYYLELDGVGAISLTILLTLALSSAIVNAVRRKSTKDGGDST